MWYEYPEERGGAVGAQRSKGHYNASQEPASLTARLLGQASIPIFCPFAQG